MSQDECSTEARRYTQRKQTRKGQHARAPLRQPSATTPTRRQRANRARHTKGSKTKSPFCVDLKIYHLNTWILHKTCLKHSNFLNRKILCTWNIMATAMGQGTEETQRVGTKFKIQQFQHAPSPDWARSPNCVQFCKTPDSAPSVTTASLSRGFKSGIASKRGDCCIEPNCYEWNICQHTLHKQEEKSLCEERKNKT